MVKVLVNALLNAPTARSALCACNRALSPRTASGLWKSGREREKAKRLRQAVAEAGVSFKELLPEVVRTHAPIAHYFGCDCGLALMNLDGRICLDVVGAFTRRGQCCLPVHDSFRVVARLEDRLLRVMRHAYHKWVGAWPVIRAAGA
jgi:hypothetical protein